MSSRNSAADVHVAKYSYCVSPPVDLAQHRAQGPPSVSAGRAGHELDLLQEGLEPTDWKPMPTVGDGVYELRIRVGGAFRLFYVMKRAGGVIVVHAFEKKAQQTAQIDLDLAAKRYRQYVVDQRQR